MGAAVGDADGDGDDDLYVTNVGPDVLYLNRGDGTFEDATAAAGLGDAGWGVSAAFFDYDRDGDQDLFVVRYVHWSPAADVACFAGGGGRDYCQPASYPPQADLLYRNEGRDAAGRVVFREVGAEAGLRRAFGSGLGVVVADVDDDGWLDVYVANDGDPNQLWINRGDGTFEDRALLAGCAVNRMGSAEAGMGVVAFDLGDDGDLDLFVTHLREESNTLYENRGGGLFDDVTAAHGLAAASIAATGFGVGAVDFDHDGRLDLYVANGRVGRTLKPWVAGDPFAEPDQLLRGTGAGRFEEVRPRGGTRPEVIANSRAAAFADYDEDGDVDLVVVANGGRARLLENLAGAGGRWIAFRLRDRDGGDAIGARVRIRLAGGEHYRTVQRASSYAASNDPRVHFGLGDAAAADDVTVLWPGGAGESFGPRAAGRVHLLVEGGSERPAPAGR